MYLKSFEIHSYRSCQKTKVDINKDLTSLIGTNGSGKTNTLSAILLLRKICDGGYVGLRSRSASTRECKIRAEIKHEDILIKLHGKIKIETDDRNNDEIIFSELKWKFSNFRNNEWFFIPLTLFSPNDNDFQLRGMSNRIFAHMRVLDKKNKINLFDLIKDNDFKKNAAPLLRGIFTLFSEINYYSATQFSDPNRCPVSIELDESRPRRRSRISSGHEQFIFDLYSSRNAHTKEYKRYLSIIDKQGIGLIDEITFQTLPIPSSTYKVESGGKIKKISDKRLLIVPIFTIDGMQLSPNQLSEGTFKTLALLYYVITDKSKLLLIEEPEVCVHHGLLDSIMELIINQSKEKQIIISTHSDFVLDHLVPENVSLVKYIKEQGTAVAKLNKSMSRGDYGALKKYLKESGNLGEYWREGGFEYE